jgi:hypothetical protein
VWPPQSRPTCFAFHLGQHPCQCSALGDNRFNPRIRRLISLPTSTLIDMNESKEGSVVAHQPRQTLPPTFIVSRGYALRRLAVDACILTKVTGARPRRFQPFQARRLCESLLRRFRATWAQVGHWHAFRFSVTQPCGESKIAGSPPLLLPRRRGVRGVALPPPARLNSSSC